VLVSSYRVRVGLEMAQFSVGARLAREEAIDTAEQGQC
jgi:hypothetical protein